MNRSLTRPVGVWLLLVAGAVAVQVLLGGITRLTDSGLSITEWKPILGVVPPTDAAGWNEAFQKYQQLPQFKLLKSDLTVDGFKVLYFWEWFHRLWGRLLGFFFAVPLVVFWRQGRLKGQKGKLLALFALGGAQGVMGWVMVASGLQDLVYVSHLRLAAHFMLAALLLAALVWNGLALLTPAEAPDDPRLTGYTVALLATLAVQLVWGALMAGLKAAQAAPSWPTINGQWFPHGLFGGGGWWWNDPLAVHFVHRTLAYLLALGVAAWWWRARKALGARRHVALALVLLQVTLGATAVVQSIYPGRLLGFGVAHQFTGLALMVALVAALQAVWRPAPQLAPEPVPAVGAAEPQPGR